MTTDDWDVKQQQRRLLQILFMEAVRRAGDDPDFDDILQGFLDVLEECGLTLRMVRP